MRFFFLWVNVTDQVGVGYFSSLRYIFLMNWENCACTLYSFTNWSMFSDTVGEEAAKFVGETANPSGFVWSFDECSDGSCSSFFNGIVVQVGNVLGIGVN